MLHSNMTITYDNKLKIPLLPVDARTAALMSNHFREKIIEDGGRNNCITKIVDTILALSPDEQVSEILRLQRLYAQVYSRMELESLVSDTFDDLGLRS